MTFRLFPICALALASAIVPVHAQVTGTPTTPAEPGTPAAAPAASSAPSPQASTGSESSQPRGLTFGLTYWFAGSGTNPNIQHGHLVTDNESLYNLGKYHDSPGINISYPITSTGTLRFEAFETKGDGNQINPAATTIFTNTIFNRGDSLATQYQTKNFKFYLDDLMWPHRFPLRRFRVKTLMGIEYFQIHTNVNSLSSTSLNLADDSRHIILPALGLAAEYQLSRNVMFRVEGTGFGLYHRADYWDAAATLSYRRGHMEIVGGAKAFHFKTSPQQPEFLIGTNMGPFAGARWHF